MQPEPNSDKNETVNNSNFALEAVDLKANVFQKVNLKLLDVDKSFGELKEARETAKTGAPEESETDENQVEKLSKSC